MSPALRTVALLVKLARRASSPSVRVPADCTRLELLKVNADVPLIVSAAPLSICALPLLVNAVP